MSESRSFLYAVTAGADTLKGTVVADSREEVVEVVLDHLAAADVQVPVTLLVLELETSKSMRDHSVAASNSSAHAARLKPARWANRTVTRPTTGSWTQQPQKSQPVKTRSQRTWCLYCTAIASGEDLVILRMPDVAMPWRHVFSRICSMLRTNHSLRRKDIHEIEGLTGFPPGETSDFYLGRQAEDLPRIERAFAGDSSAYARFYLYAWDPGTDSFVLARKPANESRTNVGITPDPASL